MGQWENKGGWEKKEGVGEAQVGEEGGGEGRGEGGKEEGQEGEGRGLKGTGVSLEKPVKSKRKLLKVLKLAVFCLFIRI